MSNLDYQHFRFSADAAGAHLTPADSNASSRAGGERRRQAWRDYSNENFIAARAVSFNDITRATITALYFMPT